MTTAMILAGAATALLFWPQGLSIAQLLPEKLAAPLSKKGGGTTFLEATAALADVKRRLRDTEALGDEQIEAINVLQLALTGGSED